jgi:hypothetical protein
MIEDIEFSVSDMAKCKGCKETILKGEPRGKFTIKSSNYSGYGYFCSKCTTEKLKRELIELKQRIKEFDKMKKEAVKVMIVKGLK